ncbi:MAG: hypothetical protein ABI127_01800 [Dokdonella sp.]
MIPGTAFTVIITTQPTSQACTLTNAIDTMASASIDNANVT